MNYRTEHGASTSDVEVMLDSHKDLSGVLRCFYCNRAITEESKLHLDHFVPIKHGGTNQIENIVPSCRYCNRSKWDDDAIVWYRDQLFFNSNTESTLLAKHKILAHT